MSEQYEPVEAGETATSEATPVADLEATEQELVTEPANNGVVAADESPAEESADAPAADDLPAAEADETAPESAEVT